MSSPDSSSASPDPGSGEEDTLFEPEATPVVDQPGGPTSSFDLPPEHDRYARRHLIAQGGMDSVYGEEDRRLEREVAMKTLRERWLAGSRRRTAL